MNHQETRRDTIAAANRPLLLLLLLTLAVATIGAAPASPVPALPCPDGAQTCGPQPGGPTMTIPAQTTVPGHAGDQPGMQTGAQAPGVLPTGQDPDTGNHRGGHGPNAAALTPVDPGPGNGTPIVDAPDPTAALPRKSGTVTVTDLPDVTPSTIITAPTPQRAPAGSPSSDDADCSTAMTLFGLITPSGGGRLRPMLPNSMGCSCTSYQRRAFVMADTGPDAPSNDSGNYLGLGHGRNEVIACVKNLADCYRAHRAPADAELWSSQAFTGNQENNSADALRHCIVSALMTDRANADFAVKAGDAHEDDAPSTAAAGAMDKHNNGVGRAVGLRHQDDEAGIRRECTELARAAVFVPHPDTSDMVRHSDRLVILRK